MNFLKNYVLGFGSFAIAVMLGAPQANAQAVKGTFNLPFEAHWANVVLEPGQYSLMVPTAADNFAVIYVSGNGKTLMVPRGVVSQKQESERSYLRVENIGDMHVIREFNAGDTGQVFNFMRPKIASKELTASEREPDSTLAVAPTTAP